MTQLERTNAAILSMDDGADSYRGWAEGNADIARNLARKLDAVMREVPAPSHDNEQWRAVDVHNAIAAIIEADQ